MRRKSLINRRAAKAADSMWRRKGMFSRLKDYKSPPQQAKQTAHTENPQSGECPNYMPEKDNPYPLCDNPGCPDSEVCCLSAHMPGPYDEPIYKLIFPNAEEA